MRRRVAILLAATAACAAPRPADPAPEPAPAAPPAAAPADAPPPEPVHPLAHEAVAVVDRQHAAYNRHDLDAFLATYADSVEIQTLADTALLVGKARLRQTTEAWFAEAPGTRTDVVDRMVLGPFVVDRQRVTGGPEGAPVEAIGIYEVREGLIRRVWSIPPAPTTK